MLSLAKVKDSAAAVNYYGGADDYYYKDRAVSQWAGQGAERLGLKGEVDIDQFRAVLDGQLPNGDRINDAGNGRRADWWRCTIT
jgi:conjugative relaxase-like TrwC/TraI family protein